MLLKQWLDKQGWSVKRFSEKTGFSYATVRNWLNYDKRCTKRHAKYIFEFTEGEVTQEEMLKIEEVVEVKDDSSLHNPI